jgi:hypothetical protein
MRIAGIRRDLVSKELASDELVVEIEIVRNCRHEAQRQVIQQNLPPSRAYQPAERDDRERAA